MMVVGRGVRNDVQVRGGELARVTYHLRRRAIRWDAEIRSMSAEANTQVSRLNCDVKPFVETSMRCSRRSVLQTRLPTWT
jgi:hypothetical protein